MLRAKVFTKATQSPNRYLTRLRGGFTKAEGAIVIMIIAASGWLLGPTPFTILPFDLPLGVYAIYLFVAVHAAWWTRKIPTDKRPFEQWLLDMARFHLRRHPFRAPRRVSGVKYDLRPAAVHQHITTLMGGGLQHDANQQRQPLRRRVRLARSRGA